MSAQALRAVDHQRSDDPQQRTLLTGDGVRISAVHWPGISPLGQAAGPSTAVVVAHGFGGSLGRPILGTVLDRFAGHGLGVLGFDFRGHGRSAGRCTLGDREVQDLTAVIAWARVLGYRRVAVVGFSMGASVAVRTAGLVGGVDAVVSVSGPAFWYYRGTIIMRRLHWAVDHRAGRAYIRSILRTRLDDEQWPTPPPMPPVEAAALIAPTPLLIVHGTADAFFPLEHPRALYAAAQCGTSRSGGPQPQLWMEPFGHAEAAAPGPLLDRIASWIEKVIDMDIDDDTTHGASRGQQRFAS